MPISLDVAIVLLKKKKINVSLNPHVAFSVVLSSFSVAH